MATCSIAAAKRAAAQSDAAQLHDYDQHLGVGARIIGAEQLVDLLLREASATITIAKTNNCLAPNNKTRHVINATKGQSIRQPGLIGR